MEELIKKLTKIEFIRYFIVGVIATIVDWGSFYILALRINFYYQFSLILSFSLGATTNYILNKIFTFRCKSKQIIGQFSVFIIISIFSLLLSMAIMFILIDLILLHKMVSRIVTTFIMLGVNYYMHKFITFNKRFFR
jgi:putative flippase GtrA